LKISMAIDANGKIHIAYFDHDTLKLGYATNMSGSWATLTPDVPDKVGLYPSLGIGADGKAKISSMKYGSESGPDLGLYYITFDGSTWEVEEAWYYPPYEPELVLDPLGVPHIAASSESPAYGILSGDQWVMEEIYVDVQFLITEMTSLALDANGAAHISFHANYWGGADPHQSIMYASNASGQWEDQEVQEGIGTYYNSPYTDIAVAPDASAHIAYFNSAHPEVRYASNKSGAWENTIIDDRDYPYCGYYPTIAVHPNGMVHLLYICQGLKRAFFPQGYTGE